MTWREISGDQNLRLAAMLLDKQGEIDALREELATAQWQAGLLAGQRDHLLKWCQEREEQSVIRIWDVYSILIRDPADETVKGGHHGAQGGNGTTAQPGPAPQEP